MTWSDVRGRAGGEGSRRAPRPGHPCPAPRRRPAAERSRVSYALAPCRRPPLAPPSSYPLPTSLLVHHTFLPGPVSAMELLVGKHYKLGERIGHGGAWLWRMRGDVARSCRRLVFGHVLTASRAARRCSLRRNLPRPPRGYEQGGGHQAGAREHAAPPAALRGPHLQDAAGRRYGSPRRRPPPPALGGTVGNLFRSVGPGRPRSASRQGWALR